MARTQGIEKAGQRVTRQVLPRRVPATWDRVTRYLREVRSELARVTWPTRQELIASTLVVVIVVLILSLYLGSWDLLFTWIFQKVAGVAGP